MVDKSDIARHYYWWKRRFSAADGDALARGMANAAAFERGVAIGLNLRHCVMPPTIEWLASHGHAVVDCSHCGARGVWSGVYTDAEGPTGVGRVTHWLPLSSGMVQSLGALHLDEFMTVEKDLETLAVFGPSREKPPFCAVNEADGPLPPVPPRPDLAFEFPWGDCPDVWTGMGLAIPIPSPGRRRTHHPSCG